MSVHRRWSCDVSLKRGVQLKHRGVQRDPHGFLKNGLVSSQIKSSAVVPLTINLEQMFLENITCETLLTPVQGEAVNTSSFLFYFHIFVFFFKLLLSWGGTFLSGRWIIPEGDNSRHQWQEQHRRVRDGSEPFTKEIKIIISYLRFNVNEEEFASFCIF